MTVLQAAGTKIGRCGDPECDLIHIMLIDRNDRPIAQITPSCDEVVRIMANICKVMDEIKPESGRAVN